MAHRHSRRSRSTPSTASLKASLLLFLLSSPAASAFLPGRPSLPNRSRRAVLAMAAYDRDLLPSRPVPSVTLKKKETKGKEEDGTAGGKKTLDAARLIGMTRVGSAAVSPDGTSAVFCVSDYDFDAKKSNSQLWRIDLAAAAALGDDALASHGHLRKLAEGKAHGWASLSSPCVSPCGTRAAFLSNRKDEEKTSVWALPLDGPGEASLLAEFPVSVGDLEWTERGGLAVSASAYVDREAVDAAAAKGEDAKDVLTVTAERDAALKDKDDKLGGLNAVLYDRLPIREWDRWLDAKMAHPFYVPVEEDGTCDAKRAQDLLAGVPAAVPSGAFGGSEDWSISVRGHAAFSARPPLAPDEAWTTNRHIYLKKIGDDGLGTCLTSDNPGYDTNPAFSPDGTRLAWLTMAGPSYEADAVGIRVHDLATGETTTLLEAEADWDYSPHSLTWSKDGARLYFAADVRSRGALCSIDATKGAKEGGIAVHTSEGSLSLHGEVGSVDGGHAFLASVQSLTMPSELFLATVPADGGAASLRQLTHFNTNTVAETALGRSGEIIYKGSKDEDVQAWLVRPAGLTAAEEERVDGGGAPERTYPMAVLYHGGPQGSSGDDWHYRWNLQYYASLGYAVLAPNFHGSTGFGHAFCRDISGNWEVGGVDTIAGVKAALAKHKWIDPERVVGLGASYGGYTSNWLNGNAPRGMFKALVCHCGTFDLRSSYYATEELFFMEKEFGGPAYTDGSLRADSPYQKYTPSAKIHEWETPALVIHGAKDFRLVESEGISTFTALQRRGVPSRLLYLPTENHHCLNYQNSMVWHETVAGWIEKWTAPPSGGSEGKGEH